MTFIEVLICTLLFQSNYLQFVTAQNVPHCRVPIAGTFHPESPIFMDNNLNIFYPTSSAPGDLLLPWYGEYLVYCAGQDLSVNNVILPLRAGPPYQQPPIVRCLNDRIFELEGIGARARNALQPNPNPAGDDPTIRIGLQDLVCKKSPKTLDWFPGEPACNNGAGVIILLGFQVDNTRNKGTIKLCYNDMLGTGIWSHTVIPGTISSKQKGQNTKSKDNFLVGRTSFRDFNPDNYYRVSSQQAIFMDIFRSFIFNDDNLRHLNPDSMDTDDELTAEQRKLIKKRLEEKEEELKEFIKKYLRCDSSYDYKDRNYFERGHLIANADKFYTAEMHSTYYFANVVPMWKSINQGNWGKMEESIRKLTINKNHLHIWVGGLDILNLDGKFIYLGRRPGRVERTMPVPKILFKIVWSSEQKQAIVFLCINNPYIGDNDISDYIICPQYSACQSMFNDVKAGYIYCCTYQNFMASPVFRAIGLNPNIPMDVQPLI